MTTAAATVDWAALIEAERPYLVRYARSKLRDADAAEDAVQDTLLAGLSAQARYRGNSSVRTWLTGILHHKILDTYRRHSVELSRLGPRYADQGNEAAVDLALHHHAPDSQQACDPAQLLEHKQRARGLMSAVSRLPRRQRDVLVLVDLHGCNSADVAHRVGISLANVWVTLHRARRMLRTDLEGSCA